MWVKELKLKNFRNYDEQYLTFNKGINYIQGDNGSGKTSLVEAIGLLALCKSIRSNDEKEIIKLDSDNAVVLSKVQNQIDRDLKIVISKNGKYIELDGNDVKKVSKIAGVVKVISFLPKDVELFKEMPVKRRKFVDLNLSMLDSGYLRILSEYNYYLTQLRDFLKEEKNDDVYVDVLLKEISKRGYRIVVKRKEFIALLNDKLKDVGDYLESNKKIFKVLYLPSISVDNENDYYLKLVNQMKGYDYQKRINILGIHLDDMKFEYDSLDLSLYGSQGQNRISVIALKLSLYELIKDKFNEQAIVVLDDVLSELDVNHQIKLLEILNQIEQVFITGTKFDLDIPVSLFTVENNNIRRNN